MNKPLFEGATRQLHLVVLGVFISFLCSCAPGAPSGNATSGQESDNVARQTATSSDEPASADSSSRCPDFFCFTETPPPDVAVDCEWSGTARAWLDENQNGAWDVTESPFKSVIFRASDQYHPNPMTGDLRTNQEGEVTFDLFLAGCPSDEWLEIYVVVPAGYKMTTAFHVRVQDVHDTGPFLFGFAQK